MNPRSAPHASVSVGSPSAVSFGVVELERDDVQLHGRMLARMVMGTALCVGAVVVLGALGVDALDAGEVFIGTWIVALGGYLLTRVAVAVHGHAVVRRVRAARAWVADPGFALSYQLVLIGCALLLPLSLHLALARSVGEHTFEGWVILSLLVVGHVHGILAFLLARRAAALARGEPTMSRAAAYGVTVAFSTVPGAFLFFVPVMAVALTGLAFVPLMVLADRLIERERDARLARGAAI